MSKSAPRREERLVVRLTAESKALLLKAAATENKSLSAFVLDSGLTAADQVLANRTEFEISSDRYHAFLQEPQDFVGNPERSSGHQP